MWWPFKRKQIKSDPGDIVFEHWESDFSGKQLSRFPEEESEGYGFSRNEEGFCLEMSRADLFAWSLLEPYRYTDFVLDLEIQRLSEGGYSSAGTIFRFADNGTFYYMVVSTSGMFRFDVVFNGTPRTLIPWTSVNAPLEDRFTITVAAHRTFFAFFINGVWVGEVEDETIDAGYIGFAGQNYHEQVPVRYCLKKAVVESRRLKVEDFYDSRVKGEDIPPENRRTLSMRFFDSGQYTASLVQLRKSLKDRHPGPEDNLLAARIHNLLGLRNEALEYINSCIESGMLNEETVLEKSGILYGLNRFLEVKSFLGDCADVWKDNPVLNDIMGNSEDALGNFEEAFLYYKKAGEQDSSNGIYFQNAGHSLEKSGKVNEALEYYKKAAALFFKTDRRSGLDYILTVIDRLDPGNSFGLIYEGKLLFEEGQLEKAFALFQQLRERGESDASVDFLYALILADRGEREAADPVFASVTEREPDYYLYWFRYAENLYLTGEDASAALEKALSLNEADPWVLNLAGLIAMDTGQIDKAIGYYRSALSADGSRAEIRINLSDALYKNGLKEEAFSLLVEEDRGDILNQKGNLFALDRDYEKAAVCYFKAVKLENGNRIYRLNYAEVLIELDRILEAEEILASLLEEKEEPGVLSRMAFIASLRGEYRRAEAAYQRALECDPSSEDVKIAYADFLVTRHDFKRAEELLDRVKDSTQGKVMKLKDLIYEASYDSYSCSECGRVWHVPKVFDAVNRIVLKGEPDPASPAGKCPSCGKVYCVECAMNHLEDNRFTCADCGEPLKLSENYLRYLAAEFAAKHGGGN